MPKYSEAVIDAIKQNLTITEVVSQYVRLTKKNNRHWGLCPFHQEKTPSFTVLEDSGEKGGFFHCFGCGKSGSMFTFVMEMEHLSFPESVERLAKLAGVPLIEESDAEKQKRSEQEALYDLYTRLAGSFHHILKNTSQAEVGRSYLKQRGISEEMIDTYQLGFAPSDPSWLYQFLSSKHYSDSLLKQSGLFSSKHQDYPLFRNRLMFPIKDWQGRCVAFGGRILTTESTAKYINTPETPIYSKRNLVYGLYEGLPSIKKEASAILCEGYLDVIALHQSGIATAVAPLGTAFTPEQGKLLKRYCEKVTTLFDSDGAGIAATKKALVICQELGMENSVILLTHAKDPGELLQTDGTEAVKRAVKHQTPGFDYLVSMAVNQYDIGRPKGKATVFKEIRPYLNASDSQIEKQAQIKRLADMLQIDESTIMNEYLQTGGEISPQTMSQATVRDVQDDIKTSVDLYAMLTLINNRELFPRIRRRLDIADLDSEQARILYVVLEDAERAAIETREVLLDMIQHPGLRDIVATSFLTEEFTQYPELILAEALDRIQLRKLERQRTNVVRLVRLATQDGTGEQHMRELLLEKQDLDRDISELQHRIALLTEASPELDTYKDK